MSDLSFLPGACAAPGTPAPGSAGCGVRPVVCGVWWWFGSCVALRHTLPFFITAERLGLRHEVATLGEENPPNPLAPAA